MYVFIIITRCRLKTLEDSIVYAAAQSEISVNPRSAQPLRHVELRLGSMRIYSSTLLLFVPRSKVYMPSL